ncbi:hypothetical protein RAZWK3B_18763 [Roseobacter sp. AzwK-3b]|nr:hypothetical protein RAZWK3B_18763 [Roseobacter sp. AzwK-3b]
MMKKSRLVVIGFSLCGHTVQMFGLAVIWEGPVRMQ